MLQKSGSVGLAVAIVVVSFLGGACKGERPEAVAENPAPGAVAAAGADLKAFWRYWSDGKAELDAYALTQPRYGQERSGRAILIYVTEPFSRSRKVKVDKYDPKNPDHTMVLKLNHVRKFQTGIYDYSVMTSAFVEPSRNFSPLEITFSMQEWCGHVFEQTHFDDEATITVNSYFEGESSKTSIETGEDFLAEDALFVAIRDLASEKLRRQDREVSMLPSANLRRMRHQPARLLKSALKWSDNPVKVTVPAGDFEAYEVSWDRVNGSRCTAQVEAAYPHKIVGWRCNDGEEAKLTGTTRLAYWGTSREGDEKLLEEIGLKPLGVSAK